MRRVFSCFAMADELDVHRNSGESTDSTSKSSSCAPGYGSIKKYLLARFSTNHKQMRYVEN